MEYGEDPVSHLQVGRAVYDTMQANCAAAGVQIDDARTALEFGSSNGRVVRWFTRPGEREIWACDIQADKVLWAMENLSPPFRFLINDPVPHLPFRDGTFDFVCALSVFTHLKASFCAWLCELLRITSPDGALYITVHDEVAFAQPDAGEVISTHFVGLDAVGDLADVRYAAINDYNGGALAQVYVSRGFIEQVLPQEFAISGVFPRSLSRQTAYLIRRTSPPVVLPDNAPNPSGASF
jgi:SAM-dependent methyltransferase